MFLINPSYLLKPDTFRYFVRILERTRARPNPLFTLQTAYSVLNYLYPTTRLFPKGLAIEDEYVPNNDVVITEAVLRRYVLRNPAY